MHHFPGSTFRRQANKQWVAIARAIAKRPEVLLCDEPDGSPRLQKTGIKVIEALLSVNEQLGTTTAIITYNANPHPRRRGSRLLLRTDKSRKVQKNETRRKAA